MASVSNIVLSVVRDVANAEVTIDYDINWSNFDQLTNLPYLDTFRLIEDDTDQDGDNLPLGDDPISLTRFVFLIPISSNGAAVTHRTKTTTLPFANLNKDSNGGNDDDEIRAVITLTPQLPVAVSRESNVVVVAA
jgi:hypothetical protein